MKTHDQRARDVMRAGMLQRLGVERPALAPSLDALALSEPSPLFAHLCLNRLIMGALRYGLVGSGAPGRTDRVESVQKRLDAYRETGNAEHLADIANLAMVEFREENHPAFHWAARDGGAECKLR